MCSEYLNWIQNRNCKNYKNWLTEMLILNLNKNSVVDCAYVLRDRCLLLMHNASYSDKQINPLPTVLQER